MLLDQLQHFVDLRRTHISNNRCRKRVDELLRMFVASQRAFVIRGKPITEALVVESMLARHGYDWQIRYVLHVCFELAKTNATIIFRFGNVCSQCF